MGSCDSEGLRKTEKRVNVELMWRVRRRRCGCGWTSDGTDRCARRWWCGAVTTRRKILSKIIVLGESGVGKTSLLLRYVENSFTIATKSTIGADFLSKQIDVDGKPVTLQIWVRRRREGERRDGESR
jgi:hypothetical protein